MYGQTGEYGYTGFVCSLSYAGNNGERDKRGGVAIYLFRVLPNAKAEHLVAAAKRISSVYGGQVPDNIEDLQTLPGVGRKTANVVCAVIWNKPTMAVDTHIFRVSERIGLTTNSKNPLQTEKELVKYIPETIIPKAHHWLLLHGRYVCQARKPKCSACRLQQWCRYYKKNAAGLA